MRTGLVAMVALAGLLAGCGTATSPKAAPKASAPAPGAAVITVHTSRPGRTIPSGFVGLSLEYTAVPAYAGTDPKAVDPVFVQLIRNLNPGQAPVLRIGGDSSDWAWWPVPGMAKPPGVRITLDRNWLQVTRALSTALGARLILGIDLEAGSRRLAAAEADAFRHGLPGGAIEALEPGNEPELYPSFGWYRNSAGHEVPGRPRGYDFAAFNREFAGYGATLAPTPLAGPTTGAPKWMADLPQFLAAQPKLRVVTLHRYPLQQCYVARTEPTYPTVGHLLAGGASRGLADSVARYAALSHRRHLPLRIDEMNTISCGGGAVGHSFASALWAADALFEMARVGVDGVNIHSYPGAPYDLFSFRQTRGRWVGTVEPEYYGLLMFAHAAPAGARLLSMTTQHANGLLTWATLGPDHHVRVLVINDGSRRRTVSIAAAGTAKAVIERLRAPGLAAQSRVTLDGRSVQPTTGSVNAPSASESVSARGGAYAVTVAPASAALLRTT